MSRPINPNNPEPTKGKRPLNPPSVPSEPPEEFRLDITQYRVSPTTSQPETPPETPQHSFKVKGALGLLLSCSGLFLGAMGMFLHSQGVGDGSSAARSKYVLGVNLGLDNLHTCKWDCYLVGPYIIKTPPEKKKSYSEEFHPKPRILPWYTELSQGSHPKELIAIIPEREPKWSGKPKNALPLPGSLTPVATRVVKADITTGRITFKDGRVFQVENPEDLAKYWENSHWVVVADPRDPEKIKVSFRVHTDERHFYTNNDYPKDEFGRGIPALRMIPNPGGYDENYHKNKK